MFEGGVHFGKSHPIPGNLQRHHGTVGAGHRLPTTVVQRFRVPTERWFELLDVNILIDMVFFDDLAW